MLEDIKDEFQFSKTIEIATDIDFGHGRIETRKCNTSNLEDKAVNYQKNIRSHWGVENKLHWTFDVSFSEDSPPEKEIIL